MSEAHANKREESRSQRTPAIKAAARTNASLIVLALNQLETIGRVRCLVAPTTLMQRHCRKCLPLVKPLTDVSFLILPHQLYFRAYALKRVQPPSVTMRSAPGDARPDAIF